MKVQYFCYTRNRNTQIDYGDFLLPSNLTSSQLKFIRDKVSSVLSDNNVKFSTPKWLLIKFDNVIVWGCCCWNHLLNESFFKDHKGRPVYGFFSIVISEYTKDCIKIPYDIEYFKQLYADRIVPYWDSYKVPNNPSVDFITGNFNYIGVASNKYVDILNTDRFKCQSLGNVNKKEVIAAALTLDNVSLLVDNDNIEQATNPKGSFMTCLTSALPVKVYPVKQICPKCQNFVEAFASSGICLNCEIKEKRRITEVFSKEDDMDQQLKRNLEGAQSQIQYLQLEIENANKRIKKKDLLIKTLLGLLFLLLLVILYEHSDGASFKSFGKSKIEPVTKVNVTKGESNLENTVQEKQDTIELHPSENLKNNLP